MVHHIESEIGPLGNPQRESGIPLGGITTAYRRLIALSEAREGRQLRFSERADMLKRRIFGGDINFVACRVTAFSLYLSLLEGLDPADILEAQEREGTKLPSLNGTNLAHGEEGADFFREEHVFVGRRFSLVISNPPWAEPEGTSWTSADTWAERVIPTVIDQNPCAHLRMPRDMIFHGWSMRLFQAWQHSATMSS